MVVIFRIFLSLFFFTTAYAEEPAQRIVFFSAPHSHFSKSINIPTSVTLQRTGYVPSCSKFSVETDMNIRQNWAWKLRNYNLPREVRNTQTITGMLHQEIQ